MAFCTNCGKPLRNDKDKFCTYCGAPVIKASTGKPSDSIREEIDKAKAEAKRAAEEAGKARSQFRNFGKNTGRDREDAEKARADADKARADADRAQAEAEKAKADAERAKADADRARTYTERTSTYAGRIVKCPNCGEVLDSFVPVCPACGYEIRDAGSSSAVDDFTARLGRAMTERERIMIIRDYPIPNTKEDILEFAILSSTNINENQNLDDEVSDAWFAKLGQAYQKAQLLFDDQPEYERVKSLYEHVEAARSREKSMKQTAGHMSAMSNIVVVTVWLLTLFILIPLCRPYLFRYYIYACELVTFLFVVDVIAGIFFIPMQCRCDSNAPKLIVTAGASLSIVLIIPMYFVSYSYRTGFYSLMIIADVICSIIILSRIYRHDRSVQMDRFSIIMFVICIGICVAMYIVIQIVAAVTLQRYLY